MSAAQHTRSWLPLLGVFAWLLVVVPLAFWGLKELGTEVWKRVLIISIPSIAWVGAVRAGEERRLDARTASLKEP